MSAHGGDADILAWVLFVPFAIAALVFHGKTKPGNPRREARRRSGSVARPTYPPDHDDEGSENAVNDALDRLDQAGWLNLWRTMQKRAYEMVGPGKTDAEKAEFRQVMTEFAKRDPNFRRVIDTYMPTIRQTPGIKQADLIRGLSEEHKEFARYALYFAHELGEIRRVKFGNSYKLFPR